MSQMLLGLLSALTFLSCAGSGNSELWSYRKSYLNETCAVTPDCQEGQKCVGDPNQTKAYCRNKGGPFPCKDQGNCGTPTEKLQCIKTVKVTEGKCEKKSLLPENNICIRGGMKCERKTEGTQLACVAANSTTRVCSYYRAEGHVCMDSNDCAKDQDDFQLACITDVKKPSEKICGYNIAHGKQCGTSGDCVKDNYCVKPIENEAPALGICKKTKELVRYDACKRGSAPDCRSGLACLNSPNGGQYCDYDRGEGGYCLQAYDCSGNGRCENQKCTVKCKESSDCGDGSSGLHCVENQKTNNKICKKASQLIRYDVCVRGYEPTCGPNLACLNLSETEQVCDYDRGEGGYCLQAYDCGTTSNGDQLACITDMTDKNFGQTCGAYIGGGDKCYRDTDCSYSGSDWTCKKYQSSPYGTCQN